MIWLNLIITALLLSLSPDRVGMPVIEFKMNNLLYMMSGRFSTLVPHQLAVQLITF